MRKMVVLVGIVALALAGCAQVFESSLFQTLDTPTKLDATTLGNASISDLSKMAKDAAFFAQLKGDSAALSAVTTNLDAVITSGTAAEKITAAQTKIQVLTYSTDAESLIQSAVSQLLPLANGGSASSLGTAIANMVAGKTAADLTATLTTLATISDAFGSLDGAASSTSAFFGTMNQGELAQIGLVAAAAKAVILDQGSASAAATALLGTYTPAGNMTALSNAISGTTGGTFDYVAKLTGIL